VSAPNDQTSPSDIGLSEKAPVIVKRAHPIYPDSARKARLEGEVWVKIWVTQNGGVKKVLVTKSSASIFNQPAIDAAWKFVFTPAILDGKPIDVWVVFPFHFRLK